jgi:hypothetical protein
MDGAQQTEGETLFQQASQSHQPDVLVKRQFEQRSQSQKSKLANEFIASAGREGLSQLAAAPDGQHALAEVYQHAKDSNRELMQDVHKEQGNTAVDYTYDNNSVDQSKNPSKSSNNAVYSRGNDWQLSEKKLNGYRVFLEAPTQYKAAVKCLSGCHSSGFEPNKRQYVTSVGEVFGAEFAVSATKHYANKQAETGNPLYAFPGAASALMLPENQVKTELVLSLGSAAPFAIEKGVSLISGLRRAGDQSAGNGTTMRAGNSASVVEVPKSNPLADPKVAKQIREDTSAIYGYSPKPGKGLDKFGIDYSDAGQVASARAKRIEYLQDIEKKKATLTEEVSMLQDEGMSLEDIARLKVDSRNKSRIDSYLQSNDLDGLKSMQERNLIEYGRKQGPTADQLFEIKGSWEDVIFGSVKSSRAMDVLLGLD